MPPHPKRRSCARCATAPATGSTSCSAPTTTTPTPTTSTSIAAADACAADSAGSGLRARVADHAQVGAQVVGPVAGILVPAPEHARMQRLGGIAPGGRLALRRVHHADHAVLAGRQPVQ